MLKILLLTVLCAQSMTPAMAFKGDEEVRHWKPVSDAVLDWMLVGFQSNPSGPVMSFGIQRSAFVNGQLVSSTVLNIPDLVQLTSDPSKAFSLVQTGGGNVVTPGTFSPASLATVIQNSLDNQTIQNQTVINATVAALSWARSLSLGSALSQANMDAIRH
jgi:hypothetical protein